MTAVRVKDRPNDDAAEADAELRARRRGGSVNLPSALLPLGLLRGAVFEAQQLTPTQKLVALAIIHVASPRRAALIPVSELARTTGFNRRTIVNAVTDLARAGWVSIEPTEEEDGSRGPNKYRVHVPQADVEVPS